MCGIDHHSFATLRIPFSELTSHTFEKFVTVT